MAPERPGERRYVEFELTGRRLAVLAVVIIAAGLALLGARACARRGGGSAAGAAGAGGAAEGAQGRVESIDKGATIFDRAGGGAAPPAPVRQVTREGALAGAFELDLGSAKTRQDAERIAALSRSIGVAASVVGQPDGSYRVAGGPFKTEAEARRQASKLAALLGRDVRVR